MLWLVIAVSASRKEELMLLLMDLRPYRSLLALRCLDILLLFILSFNLHLSSKLLSVLHVIYLCYFG